MVQHKTALKRQMLRITVGNWKFEKKPATLPRGNGSLWYQKLWNMQKRIDNSLESDFQDNADIYLNIISSVSLANESAPSVGQNSQALPSEGWQEVVLPFADRILRPLWSINNRIDMQIAELYNIRMSV